MEKNLTKKEERIREKERLSTVVTNKMIIVFLALVFAIVVLVRVSSDASAMIGFLQALPYIQIAFGVLTLAALVYYIISSKRGVDAKYKAFSAPLLLGISASGLFTVLMHNTFGDTFRSVLVMLAFALLFFVYQIYSVDFFACSIAVVAACVAAALVNSAGVPAAYTIVCDIICVVVSAAAAFGGIWFVNRLAASKKLELFGRKIKRPQNMIPAAVCAVMAISFAAFLFSLIFGYLLYSVAVIAVVYIVVAIIYTVKLM